MEKSASDGIDKNMKMIQYHIIIVRNYLPLMKRTELSQNGKLLMFNFCFPFYFLFFFQLGPDQRVLNNLQRIRLSCGRIINSISRPPPSSPSPVQQIVSLYQASCVSPVELTSGRRGGGNGRTRNLALCKSFNTLWSHCFSQLT